MNMKFLKFALISGTAATILPIAVSCDIGVITPDKPTTDDVKVTFDPNGGEIEGSTESKYCYVEKGDRYFMFAHPVASKSGYKFAGWLNPQGQKMIDQEITEDIILTADYQAETPEAGDDIICTVDGDEWIASPETICSTTGSIHLTSTESAATKDIPRASFNPTDVLIGENISSIEDNFMFGCSAFNGTITFANATESELAYIGMSFLEGCTSFNSQLIFPNSLRVMGSSFMAECSAFDSDISFPEATAIGMDFLSECTNFSKTITIPSTMKFIAASFMWCCDNFTNLVLNTEDASAWTSDDASTLIVKSTTCKAWNDYITVTGTGKDSFLSIFIDVQDTVAQNYRRFVR